MGLRRRFLNRAFIGLCLIIIGIGFYVALGATQDFVLRAVAPLGALIAVVGGLLVAFYALQIFLEFGSAFSRMTAIHFEDDVSVDEDVANDVNAPTPPLTEAKQHLPRTSRDVPRHVQIAERMRLRLTNEIEAQGRKANTNLIMGVFTAFAAVSFLTWLALQATSTFASLRAVSGGELQYGNHQSPVTSAEYFFYSGIFLSKVTLSITASIFSFFFLSTYRRNLGEIKYFQNEMTNIEMRLLSLAMAEEGDFKEVLQRIIAAIATTERNFILKKGEITLDLRSRELDVGEVGTLSNLVARAAADAVATFKAGEREAVSDHSIPKR